MGISPHRIARLFVKSSAPCRVARLPLVPYFARCRALRVRSPASKYIYIDAFRCQSVTRETLLRYTLNSIPVNNLISGNLWKNNASSAPVGRLPV